MTIKNEKELKQIRELIKTIEQMEIQVSKLKSEKKDFKILEKVLDETKKEREVLIKKFYNWVNEKEALIPITENHKKRLIAYYIEGEPDEHIDRIRKKYFPHLKNKINLVESEVERRNIRDPRVEDKLKNILGRVNSLLTTVSTYNFFIKSRNQQAIRKKELENLLNIAKSIQEKLEVFISKIEEMLNM